MLYCPACANHMIVMVNATVWVRGELLPCTYCFCTGCALVSEVNPLGQLRDLGRITVSDCEEPTCPVHNPPVAFVLDMGRPFEGRNES